MARSKLDKTLADYMAIAITPALIMLLTGSLVWFWSLESQSRMDEPTLPCFLPDWPGRRR